MIQCKEPISRFLISNGLCSQRSSKNFIKNNSVAVNGSYIEDSSFYIDSEHDTVSVNGRELEKTEHIYVMLNKPCGIVCSTASDSHKTVYDILKGNFPESILYKLKCVGRLDSDTSGLLLLSTNGSFVNKLTDPENEIEKTYLVKLRDKVSDRNLYVKNASEGIEIPAEKKSAAFKSKPAKIKWLNDDTLEITVTEGKFREVRRIFSALGNCVVELKRIRIGQFVLDDNLKEGEFKIL